MAQIRGSVHSVRMSADERALILKIQHYLQTDRDFGRVSMAGVIAYCLRTVSRSIDQERMHDEYQTAEERAALHGAARGSRIRPAPPTPA
jgi:hypothetical protein